MIGKYNAKLDEKFRLFVPSKLRMELGDTFYVTVGINCGHKCLTVYTSEDWDGFCKRYAELPISQQGGASSLFFHKAQACSPDKQFRFSLNQELMNFAGIDRDVIIVGRAGQAEIWSVEEYERFELENLTPEKLLESLEAIGL